MVWGPRGVASPVSSTGVLTAILAARLTPPAPIVVCSSSSLRASVLTGSSPHPSSWSCEGLGAAATVRGTWGLQRLKRTPAGCSDCAAGAWGWHNSVATIGWQQLRGYSCVATFSAARRQQLRGNNCVATFSAARWQQLRGNNCVATIAWQHLARGTATVRAA